jgi:hypothetical protein
MERVEVRDHALDLQTLIDQDLISLRERLTGRGRRQEDGGEGCTNETAGHSPAA